MTLQAGTAIGKYVVKRKLAEGGMAEIYLASVQGPEGFEKDVVIKRIRSFLSTDPEFVQMFIAEAKLAARLNHANIVQIFDFGQHEDAFYLAMEYVRGRSLWDVRKRCRQKMMVVPPTVVAQVGLDVARGLHYAHHLKEHGQLVGLVHRDVTPHNVLLAWEGAVKLTDFGIAKAGNKLTTPGMLKGKFAYMSPEQSRGDSVDARTDVFALGIVLWEMLTGGRLFEGDSDVAVLRAVQQSHIAPPGRLNPDVHPDLDAVVMRALERDVDKRYQSAQELERALGQFILGHAKSIDDTDIGGFLDRLYADEKLEDGREKTTAGFPSPLLDEPPAAPAPAAAAAAPASAPPKHEPTAVMPSSSGQKVVEPKAWDEDAHAETYVVSRGERASPQPQPQDPSAGASVRPTILLDLPALREAQRQSQPAAPSPVPMRQLPVRQVPPEPPTITARQRPDFGPRDSTRVAMAKIRAGKTRRLGVLAGGAVLAAVGVSAAVIAWQPSSRAGSDADAGEFAAVLTPLPAGAWTAPAAGGDAGAPEVEVAVVQPGARTVDAGAPAPAPEPVQEPVPLPEPARPAVAAKSIRHLSNPGEGERAHVGTGTLVIRATPFATVFIDGEKRGDVTGQGEFRLSPGKYLVRLVHPRRTLERVVNLRSGEREKLTFELLKR